MKKRLKSISVLLMLCLVLSTAHALASTEDEPITLYPRYLQVPLGQHVTLDAQPRDRQLIWSSSDESVAVVDKNGRITSVALGETAIAAAFADTPDIKAECGVLVTADGNIFFWDDEPEPYIDDALMAQFIADSEAEEAEIEAEANAGLPWPEGWPNELPKLDGTIIVAFGSADEPDGMAITVEIQGADDAKAYTNALVALGFEMDMESDSDSSYFADLSGGGYKIAIMYFDNGDEKLCMLRVFQ